MEDLAVSGVRHLFPPEQIALDFMPRLAAVMREGRGLTVRSRAQRGA